MPIPSQNRIIEPLLIELHKCGGSSRPSDLYDRIAAHFPEMDDDDINAELKSGHSVFNNRVQWTRQRLVDTGHIDGSVRGVWTLTVAGKEHAEQILPTGPSGAGQSSLEMREQKSLVDLLQDHDRTIREELLHRLINVTPAHFEHLSGQLLRKLGFRAVEVTNVSNDGGIDGHGLLKMGIVSVNAAFQCKRYAPNASVGRPDVDAFRGATQGRYDQAIFITTGRFSKPASEESLRPGTIPIIMIDGESMLDLMIEHGIGISHRPLNISLIDEDFFAVDED